MISVLFLGSTAILCERYIWLFGTIKINVYSYFVCSIGRGRRPLRHNMLCFKNRKDNCVAIRAATSCLGSLRFVALFVMSLERSMFAWGALYLLLLLLFIIYFIYSFFIPCLLLLFAFLECLNWFLEDMHWGLKENNFYVEEGVVILLQVAFDS